MKQLKFKSRDARILGMVELWEARDGTRFRICTAQVKNLGTIEALRTVYDVERRLPREGRFVAIGSYDTLAEARRSFAGAKA